MSADNILTCALVFSGSFTSWLLYRVITLVTRSTCRPRILLHLPFSRCSCRPLICFDPPLIHFQKSSSISFCLLKITCIMNGWNRLYPTEFKTLFNRLFCFISSKLQSGNSIYFVKKWQLNASQSTTDT